MTDWQAVLYLNCNLLNVYRRVLKNDRFIWDPHIDSTTRSAHNEYFSSNIYFLILFDYCISLYVYMVPSWMVEVTQTNLTKICGVLYVRTELFVKSMLVSHLFLRELVDSKRWNPYLENSL